MKAPLSTTEKVQRFLARVPDADAATIAKAKGLSVDEVEQLLRSMNKLPRPDYVPLAGSVLPPAEPLTERQTLEWFFRSAFAHASARAKLRLPARCTSALATLHEMEDLFGQLLGELGEEA